MILLLLVIIVVVVGAAALFLGGVFGGPPPEPTAVAGGVETPGAGELPTATPIQLTKVVIAVNNLDRGMRIPANGVDEILWPAQSVPFGALNNKQLAIGRIARTDIPPGQVIVDKLLITDLTQLAKRGSDAAAVIPSGLRAVAVPMDRLTGVAYALQDGDYVDVIVSMLFVDVDPNFQSIKPNKISVLTLKPDGSIDFSPPISGDIQPSTFTQGPMLVIPSENQRPRLVTQTTVKRALVIHVGNFPLDGNYLASRATPPPTPTPPEGAPTQPAPPPTPTPPIPDIVTLAVSPQDAVEMVWYIESRIPITLTLRNPLDEGKVDTDQVTLSYITTKYNVSQPLALPYALEPALRSIRHLVIGNELAIEQTK
jgi:Flp pilus assembly protein CpaB